MADTLLVPEAPIDPFVTQLAHLCATQRTRVKWVFVPTHALGRTLGERIALAGTDWLNLRFVTPLDIALRMGAPFLVERGIDPSEEGLGPALMMRLLLDLPAQDGYFRPLADQPSLADAVWTTLRELRMAGLGSDDLPAAAFETPAKHAEVVALLAAYEAHLDEQGRADMATVYQEALAHPDWCPIQPEDCWTELPHALWTPLQRRLLDAMPGERLTPRLLALPNVAVPRRLKAAPADPAEPDPATSPLAFLMAPQTVPTAHLAVFHAGGREAEIEEVFRRILAAGEPLDTVEIACASAAHVTLAWEKALRHEWPVTLGRGIAAAQTRPGRALLGLCDWIETDFSAGHLRRLLQSGDVEVDVEAFGFTAHQAARILARAEAGWGRETYRLALGRLRHRYETRAADPDVSADDRKAAADKAEQTAKVLDRLTALLGSIPVPDSNGQVPLQTVVGAALHFLERSAARKNALDTRAASGLAEHVGDLRQLGAFSCSLAAALRFIRERVQSLSVAPERPRPGHLYVCDLAHAGYAGRASLFVVGLEEGRVFPAAAEDPVLLDQERTAISPDLRLSTDRLDEAVYIVLARLATSGAARVTCSYSCRDTREFRETYASWLMLQICRVEQGNPALSYPEMKALLGEPVSVVPVERDRATTSSGWMVRSVLGTGDAGLAAIDNAFPGVAAGRRAEAARASSAFTEYDGAVAAAGPALDPCASGNTYSVTDLEGVAECPFRFFLKRGLGIRPLEDDEPDRDVWLDPLTRGSELHDLYARALRRCRDEKRPPSLEIDGPWLRTFAEERLAALQREMPAPTAEIHDRESQQFLADVELFLAEECRAAKGTPIAFEVSFGRPLDGEVEPLARAEPIDIDLGGGLTFRIAGRIDRINQVGPNAFEVLDYKTGSFWRDKWLGVFDGGQRLQHALYGLAAAELLRAQCQQPKVAGGVYYFSSHRGGLERVPIPAPTKAAIARVLADLRQVIRDGAFVHAPSADACKFCDYAAACGDAVHQQADAKMGDPRLATFVRLGTHA